MTRRESRSSCLPASKESSTGGWVASSARSKHRSARDTNAAMFPVTHHSSSASADAIDETVRFCLYEGLAA